MEMRRDPNEVMKTVEVNKPLENQVLTARQINALWLEIFPRIMGDIWLFFSSSADDENEQMRAKRTRANMARVREKLLETDDNSFPNSKLLKKLLNAKLKNPQVQFTFVVEEGAEIEIVKLEKQGPIAEINTQMGRFTNEQEIERYKTLFFLEEKNEGAIKDFFDDSFCVGIEKTLCFDYVITNKGIVFPWPRQPRDEKDIFRMYAIRDVGGGAPNLPFVSVEGQSPVAPLARDGGGFGNLVLGNKPCLPVESFRASQTAREDRLQNLRDTLNQQLIEEGKEPTHAKVERVQWIIPGYRFQRLQLSFPRALATIWANDRLYNNFIPILRSDRVGMGDIFVYLMYRIYEGEEQFLQDWEDGGEEVVAEKLKEAGVSVEVGPERDKMVPILFFNEATRLGDCLDQVRALHLALLTGEAARPLIQMELERKRTGFPRPENGEADKFAKERSYLEDLLSASAHLFGMVEAERKKRLKLRVEGGQADVAGFDKEIETHREALYLLLAVGFNSLSFNNGGGHDAFDLIPVENADGPNVSHAFSWKARSVVKTICDQTATGHDEDIVFVIRKQYEDDFIDFVGEQYEISEDREIDITLHKYYDIEEETKNVVRLDGQLLREIVVTRAGLKFPFRERPDRQDLFTAFSDGSATVPSFSGSMGGPG